MNTKLLVKKLDAAAILPKYASAGAAGADLYSLPGGDITIASGETVLIHTGIAAAIPEGYVGLICARSGLATKQGLAPANKVGVIDCDYRGEIMVALHNHSSTDRTVSGGERIAQMLIMPIATAEIEETEDLDSTERGSGGFGSTGVR